MDNYIILIDINNADAVAGFISSNIVYHGVRGTIKQCTSTLLPYMYWYWILELFRQYTFNRVHTCTY